MPSPISPHPSSDAGEAPLNHTGLLNGLGAYVWWGFLAMFFPLLAPAGAFEIGAHRVIWSLVFCVAVLAALGQLGSLRDLLRNPRMFRGLAIAALLLSVNWVVFLYSVLTDRVLDASLGYFINPLVTVLLAVLVLGEKLRPLQWCAIGMAAAGVIVIGIGYGSLPWIALVLAVSFGLYGFAKKQLGPSVDALPGLATETLALTPLALAYLGYLVFTGQSTFLAGDGGPFGTVGHALLLMVSGVATSVPLIMFAAASRRLPLATMGSLQFVTPVMQFLLGVFVYHEHMAPTRWAGFVLVWVALTLVSIDGYRVLRKNPPAAP